MSYDMLAVERTFRREQNALHELKEKRSTQVKKLASTINKLAKEYSQSTLIQAVKAIQGVMQVDEEINTQIQQIIETLHTVFILDIKTDSEKGMEMQDEIDCNYNKINEIEAEVQTQANKMDEMEDDMQVIKSDLHKLNNEEE